MDVTAKGEDDDGRICNGPECGEEESRRIDPSLLDSIPSSIPSSCIYNYQDFIATQEMYSAVIYANSKESVKNNICF